MTWKEDIGKKFSLKVTSGQITEEQSFTTNGFHMWKIFAYFRFMFETKSFCKLRVPDMWFIAIQWICHVSVTDSHENLSGVSQQINN
jgi:hypothetical protein